MQGDDAMQTGGIPFEILLIWRHQMSGAGTGRGITEDTRHFLEYTIMRARLVNQKLTF
jgi:hypothetical protein